ncbi:MAG: sodium:solute symporter family protein [Ignavibacteria bacterium]|nr:sodium:solute symporter family protein [Ignavibacteria bacterium]
MMTFSSEDYLILVAYFVLVLVIGFVASRKQSSTTGFLLAGRTLTLPLFVMTLVSSWYGGILGVGEFSYLYGISNWIVQGLPYYLFAILFAFLLAGRIRATSLHTIPEHLGATYDAKTALLGAGLTFLLTSPAPYILMIGILLQVVLGWSLTVCLIVGTVVTTAYLFTGGFRADVYTDMVEFVVMFLGFGIAVPYAFIELGGFSFVSENVPPSHLTWHGGNSWQFIAVWFLIALWTLVDPAFHQRCYAARDEKTARNGILLSIPFWFLFDALTAATGLYARAAMPEIADPVMAFPLFAELLLPPVLKGLFFAGMLATVMSTLNTMTFISGTTLGHDILGRLTPGLAKGNNGTRIGLLVTAVVGIVLCLLVPSVIGLWYVIGTTIIPGLLIPVVTGYFPRLRLSAPFAFATMLSGWLVSTAWLLAGWSGSFADTEAYPLGIEPMFPGLVAAGVVWVAGRLR